MNVSEASPRARDIAQHLIAYEATIRRRSARTQPAAFRVCEKMRRPLVRLTGSAGFNSLVARALALAKRETDTLDGLKVKEDDEEEEEHEDDEGEEDEDEDDYEMVEGDA